MKITTDKKQVFVDTNVLIFANTISSPFHQRAKSKLIELSDNDYDFFISSQIVREYFAVLSRPDANGKKIPTELLIKDAKRLRTEYNVLFENNQSLDNLQLLLSLCPTGGKQIHDANIVSTMLANNLNLLVTHNVDDFARFKDFITILAI